jgi:lysophospholipase L1-like esterase
MHIRREVVGALVALVLAGCAAASASPDDGSDATRSTTVGGVGVLPTSEVTPAPSTSAAADTESSAGPSTEPTTTDGETTTTEFTAEGNRVLLIGDSILASTSKRYSNDTCKALVPLGWQVEVEAEVSRGIHFANDVLKSRLKAGWDAAVIFLGTNNASDPDEYLRQLDKIITTLEPRPVVLITVTEYRPEMRRVNDIIRGVADVYPDRVSVIAWDEITSDQPSLLNTDGIHPSVEGRVVLAQAIADHLGHAPLDEEGACLDSVFRDDSAGSIETGVTSPPRGSTGSGGTPTTTTKPGGGSPTTTVKPGSSTTVGGGVSTTVGSTIGTVVLTPATTAPPNTQPVTSPAVTAPPAANPPAGGSVGP